MTAVKIAKAILRPEINKDQPWSQVDKDINSELFN